jgi:hypothetical protein
MNKKTIKLIIFSFAIILFIVSALISYIFYKLNRIEKERLADAIFYNAPIEQKKKILDITSKTLQLDFPASTELVFADPTKGDFECILALSEKLYMSINDLKSFEEQLSSNNTKYHIDNKKNKNTEKWLKSLFPKRIWCPEKSSKLLEITYNEPYETSGCTIKTCYEKEQGAVYLDFGAF